MNEGETGKSREDEFYFRIHCVIIAAGVSCYLAAIGWLVWRIVVGGMFELVLGVVVIAVLLCIVLVGWGSAAAIALEGRSQKSEVKPVPAQPKVVTADRWTILSPFERRRFS